ncbi:MAG: hypothetical protein MJZ52_07200 [Bacteroidales bacterium]|nr:hypothetical protein [Bacteroidales bacterium]
MITTIIVAIVALLVGMVAGSVASMNEMCERIYRYQRTIEIQQKRIEELKANQEINIVLNNNDDQPNYFTDF